MNEKAKSMPDRFHSLDNTMSLEKIIQAQNTGTPLIGIVVLWNSMEKHLEVHLGNGYYGYIPENLVSIYPNYDTNGKLSASTRAVIGKSVLVTVTEVDTSSSIPVITLSRKNIMMDTFNRISNSIGNLVECRITAFCPYGIYVDVGNGISGLIHHRELCVSKLNSFYELGIKEGDIITAKVLSVNENFHVSLSYKAKFKNLAFVLSADDLIETKLLYPLNEDGYFVYLNPNTPAVVNIPEHVKNCNYGSKILARVKGTRTNHPDELKLTFVSFID